MNKQELIEMLRSKIEYANDIQNTTFDIFVSEATDLLRELEGDDKKQIKPKLWKIAEHMVSETLRFNTFDEGQKKLYLSSKYLMEEMWFDYMDEILFPDEDLPQPPKTEK